MKKVTLKIIKQEVHKMDPKLDEGDNAFKTAVVLLASTVVGPYADKVSKFTGYPREFVRERGRRLRKNEVWKDGKICADWLEKDGVVAFWLDTAVAEGFLNKVPA
jgi:hypothetical protein